MVREFNKVVFLYANQPVIKYDNSYYTRFKNFLDFLAELTKQDSVYRLVVPCKVVKHLPDEAFTPINLPDKVVEVSYCSGHMQTIITTIRNVVFVRALVMDAIRHGEKVTFAGPGPNSFLFWLSYLTPKSIRFAFFIRGDTLKTVQHIYSKHLLYPFITGLVKLFRRRVHSLVEQGRTQVFLFGDKLKEQYPGHKSIIYRITPLIDKSFIRKDLRSSISEGKPLKVLFVGRLSHEKNILSLIEACVLSYKAKRSFDLSIIGFGRLKKDIHKRIAESSLQNQVKLLGYVPHGEALIEEYDRHDLLCLPSYTEGIPRAVIESFARGMPVLATPVGSLPNLFPEEIKFLDGFEVEDILKGIYWCDSHRSELSAMGRNGQNAIHPFLIHKNAIRVDKLLQSFK